MTDPAGQQGPTSSNSRLNTHQFLIDQSFGRISGAKVVKVVAIHGGGIDKPGTIDVMPLVNQIDGNGNSMPHGIIYGIPYTRSQGSGNVVVNDPVVGDIGWMVPCDRDISVVKSTKAQANPGSRRRFDAADGIYIGAILNGAPTQHIAFTASGIEIADKNGNKIVMGPAGINLNGVIIDQSGNITSSGTIINNGKHVDSTHTHGGISPGGSNTAVPN